MKVGDKITIGKKARDKLGIELVDNKATVIRIYKNFILVEHEAGWKECINKLDLVKKLTGKEKK